MKNNDKNTILCRCQDISKQEVLDAIGAGITDLEELKRFLHIGMGPCQGRTCGRLVAAILSEKTGRPPAAIGTIKKRPPLVPVQIKSIVKRDHGQKT